MDKAMDGSKVPRPSITREARKGSQSYELFQAAESSKWVAESYEGTEIVEVNPINNWDEEVVGLIIPRGKEDMTEGLLAVARERFPDLANNEEGEKVLETNTRMGNRTRRKRILVARPDAEDPTEAMYRGIVELGSIASLEGADMISFAAPAFMAGTARKMAACVLVAKLGILARVCVPKRQLRQAEITRPPLARQTSTRPKKHRHDAILIKGTKREEYPELLAKARKAIRGTTSSGGSAKEVAKLIAESKVGEKVEALTGGGKATIMMTNIEAALSEEEVKAAIVEQTGAAAKDIEIRNLRGGLRSKQSAVVLAPADVGATILAHKGIIMGLTPASVRPRLNIEKCHKCWEHGHTASRCAGLVKMLPQMRQSWTHGREMHRGTILSPV
ncbi:unnamed protein product [Brassicogethes aeneus]|uniref:CCHC-type domain-containing protein n=1 Tax=Brassicogethes aeneus TaxID=1431903 RepID=A0A9P0B3Z9_BRAAE|nr:unnamed protein product [Brassicogethes aeneus]